MPGGVGGFVFGLLVFPQGTKSAPEHARKNRPSKEARDTIWLGRLSNHDIFPLHCMVQGDVWSPGISIMA